MKVDRQGRGWRRLGLACLLAFMCTYVAAAVYNPPVLVSDVAPGVRSFPSQLQFTGALGNRLIFQTGGGGEGRLWRTDGKNAQTFSFFFPPGLRVPGKLTELAGVGYFVAYDRQNDWALWRTDATSAGTRKLASLIAGPNSSFVSDDEPRVVRVLGKKLLINAYALVNTTIEGRDAVVYERSLLAFDTETGTLATLAGIWQFDVLNESAAVELDGKLYFRGGAHRDFTEVWVTDGTRSGTATIASLTAAEDSFMYATELRALGTRVLFKCSQHLCSYETSTNTVTTLNVFLSHYSPYLTRYEDIFLFFGGTTSVTEDLELWRTDGTPANTLRISEINPGSGSAIGTDETPIVVAGDRAVFWAHDGSERAVWTTDGSSQNTSKLLTLPEGWKARPIGGIDGTAYIAAEIYNGFRWYQTDGTPAGTRLMPDITAGNRAVVVGTVRDGIFLSTSYYANDPTLWYHDPSTGRSAQLSGTNRVLQYFETADKQLFFSVYHPEGPSLHVSDGSVAGTGVVLDSLSAVVPNGSQPRSFVDSNGTLYFVSGGEVWRTNGPRSDTTKVAAPDPAEGRFIESLYACGSDVYFQTWTIKYYQNMPRATDYQLSRIRAAGGYDVVANQRDGAKPVCFQGSLYDAYIGLRRIGDPPFTPDVEALKAHASGNHLFFTASNGELWLANGGTSGARRLLDSTGAALLDADAFAARASSTYFLARNSQDQFHLYRFDGTTVAQLSSDPFPVRFTARNLVPLDTGVFVELATGVGYSDSPREAFVWFVPSASTQQQVLTGLALAGNPVAIPGQSRVLLQRGVYPSFQELWVSDGTVAGTTKLKDFPDAEYGPLLRPTVYNGRLILLAATSAGTTQVWHTDGTTEGTVQESEATLRAPGSGLVSGDKLYFAATSSEFGAELYVVDDAVSSGGGGGGGNGGGGNGGNGGGGRSGSGGGAFGLIDLMALVLLLCGVSRRRFRPSVNSRSGMSAR